MNHTLPFLSIFTLFIFLSCSPPESSKTVATISIRPEILHPIDSRLFGQFMERPSWGGETGPEAVYHADHPPLYLPPEAVEKIKSLAPPILRFPGGTDIDYHDWTDMITHLPGQPRTDRPASKSHHSDFLVGNRYGFHEFFALAEHLEAETIIPILFLNALKTDPPLEVTVRHATAQVAYLSAPLGTPLPDGMADWPAARAANGRAEPFQVDYIQIGNEWFMTRYSKSVTQSGKITNPREIADRYLVALHAMIKAIREVNPEVKLIIDARFHKEVDALILADPFIQQEVAAVAFHTYTPLGVSKLFQENRKSLTI
jgi:alpha-N-arabinofuranosidase